MENIFFSKRGMQHHWVRRYLFDAEVVICQWCRFFRWYVETLEVSNVTSAQVSVDRNIFCLRLICCCLFDTNTCLCASMISPSALTAEELVFCSILWPCYLRTPEHVCGCWGQSSSWKHDVVLWYVNKVEWWALFGFLVSCFVRGGVSHRERKLFCCISRVWKDS